MDPIEYMLESNFKEVDKGMRTFTYNKLEEIREYAEERILDFKNDYDGSLSIFNPDDGDYSEAHQELFNTDYYIIGTYKATEWFGSAENVFIAIELVTDYEQENFGEVLTAVYDPERLVNMCVYILGEIVLPEVIDSYLSRVEMGA